MPDGTEPGLLYSPLLIESLYYAPIIHLNFKNVWDLFEYTLLTNKHFIRIA